MCAVRSGKTGDLYQDVMDDLRRNRQAAELPDDVVAKKWTLIVFFKDGTSRVTDGPSWVYDTKQFADEVARLTTENIAGAWWSIHMVDSGIPPFFKIAFSHIFPIPLKE